VVWLPGESIAGLWLISACVFLVPPLLRNGASSGQSVRSMVVVVALV